MHGLRRPILRPSQRLRRVLRHRLHDEASRDAYLPHPEHERVKAQILAVLEAGPGEAGLASAIAFDWVER